jgi:hypothetical protein
MGRPRKENALPKAIWLPTTQTANHLGTTADTLYRHKRLGYLKLGYHYRIVSPPGGKQTCAWNIEALAELFSTPPELRKVVAAETQS